jgi:integrase
MRTPRPWFRQSENAWYVQLGKSQKLLAKGRENEEEAYRAFYRLMAEEGLTQDRKPATMYVRVLCDLFLEHSSKHNAADTYTWYKRFLQSFIDFHGYGKLLVTELRPHHVNRWLDDNPWEQTSRWAAITSVKRAVNWGVEEGYLDASPLARLKKPEPKRREKIIETTERKAIIGALKDRAFKILVFALSQTACRPGELRLITAKECHLDRGYWKLAKHKTAGKTGKPRLIYLNRAMVKLCRVLIREHPTGPIFRNRRGNPWKKSSIRLRFYRLRRRLKLDKGIVAYTMRHTWATQALEKGVPIATVAELLGHQDVRMVSKHYGHLGEKTEYLRNAAEQATRGGDAAAPARREKPPAA